MCIDPHTHLFIPVLLSAIFKHRLLSVSFVTALVRHDISEAQWESLSDLIASAASDVLPLYYFNIFVHCGVALYVMSNVALIRNLTALFKAEWYESMCFFSINSPGTDPCVLQMFSVGSRVTFPHNR